MPDWSTLPESFQLDSGLRDDITLTIVSAYFSYTANYQDGRQIRLVLNGFDEEQEPFTHKMGVGADWTSPDQGRTITHPTKKRINKSSIYGHFLTAALDIPELKDILISRDKDGLGARNAEIWMTLILHLSLKTITFGRGIEPRDYLLPDQFIGLANTNPGQLPGVGGSVGTVPTVTAPSPQPVAYNPPPVPDVGATATAAPGAEIPAAVLAAREAARAAENGVRNPLVDTLADLARQHPTHQAFMDAAFQIPEVLTDDNLAVTVADPSKFYANYHN